MTSADNKRQNRDTPTGYDFTQDDALKPSKAIRTQCMHCVCDKPSEIRRCTASAHPTDPGGCFLWPFRMGRGKDLSKGHPNISRRKAMRKECLRCMGGSSVAVRECVSTYCPLWPYRHGKGIEDVRGHHRNPCPSNCFPKSAVLAESFSPESTFADSVRAEHV